MLNSAIKPWRRHIAALLLSAASCASAAASHVDYRVETLFSGLTHPWSLAFLPDGGLLLTERAGRLRHITADGQLLEAPVAGLPGDIFVAAQAGLMDVVLDRDFDRTGWLFLSYACGTESANTTCLARGEWQDGALAGVREIFRALPEKPGAAHYGGRIAQLPDRTLLLSTGDRFTYREEAQNPDNHLGKIVRLNVDGSIPEDNPFIDRAGAAKAIYSLGHRNPQGLLYDAVADRVVSHEHGPRGGDELNLIQPGANYGWPLVTSGIDYTGAMISPLEDLPGMESPLLTWTPALAPSGLMRYHGEAFPQWQGDFFLGGLAGQSLRRIRISGQTATEEAILLADRGARIRDVYAGPEGYIYLLTDSPDGKLLVLQP